MSDDKRSISVKLDPLGYGTIELGGVDISKYTRGIRLESYVGSGSDLVLELAAGISIDFDGEDVRVVVEKDEDETESELATSDRDSDGDS